MAWVTKALLHEIINLYGPSDHSLDEADAALIAAKKAIEIEPNLPTGYIFLGTAYQSKGKWLEAEPNYRKAITLLDQSFSDDEKWIVSFYLM